MLNRKKSYKTTLLIGILIIELISPINANAVSDEIINTGRATIDGVSVRSSNSYSSKYLGTLRTGDKVEILEKTSNGYYKFKYKDSYAYVSSEFVKLSTTKTVDNVLNRGTVYNTNKLTLRKSCSNKSEFVGYIKKDTEVEIVRVTSSNWYKIKHNNSYAYVKSEYIKLENSSDKRSENTIKRQNLDNFLFVGDSYTHRITNTIKNHNNKVYIHAQGGSRPSYWLDKVDDMPNKNDIDGICLLIGVNGIDSSKNLTYTKSLINQLVAKYPDKNIYIQKVFPVGYNFKEKDPITYNKLIEKYNKELEEYCDTKENIKWINTTFGFVNKDGYLINTTDGLHIDESNNDYYYNNILTSIVK